MYSRAELACAFRAIGVAAADTVMLHASIRAVGPVAGGPGQIHLAVKHALTPEGTLIMYASCPEYVDEVGRGHLDGEQARELVETLLHYAEHIVDIDGKRVARFKVPIEENGTRVWREMAEVDTSDRGAHPGWPDRFFAQIVDAYLAQTGNSGGRVGDAPSFLLEARGLLQFALPVMQAVAADRTSSGRGS